MAGAACGSASRPGSAKESAEQRLLWLASAPLTASRAAALASHGVDLADQTPPGQRMGEHRRRRADDAQSSWSNRPVHPVGYRPRPSPSRTAERGRHRSTEHRLVTVVRLTRRGMVRQQGRKVVPMPRSDEPKQRMREHQSHVAPDGEVADACQAPTIDQQLTAQRLRLASSRRSSSASSEASSEPDEGNAARALTVDQQLTRQYGCTCTIGALARSVRGRDPIRRRRSASQDLSLIHI